MSIDSRNPIILSITSKETIVPALFVVIASALTIYHSLLYPHPLAVFHLILIAALFTILIVYVVFLYSNNINNLKTLPKFSIFMCSYIVLITWLGINKTIPENKQIQAFQNQRIQLIYLINAKNPEYIKQLGLLYMNASPAISRVEPHANHSGTKLLQVFLTKKIDQGKGKNYKDLMYDVAESSFIYTSRDEARTWYENAQKFGRPGAMQRYESRMVHHR